MATECGKYVDGHIGPLFVHLHEAGQGRPAFVFVNPLFDEKNRSQNFQANTARALCSMGYNVLRFDFSCTGDSWGESYELSGDYLKKDFDTMVDYAKQTFKSSEISLLGIRAGADLALRFSQHRPELSRLYLVEPVFSGARYITEQRMRRKMFHKLNQMDPSLSTFRLNGKDYEDFQGYLLDPELVKYIESIDSLSALPEKKNIFLFKADYLFSKKSFATFVTSAGQLNQVSTIETRTESFWEKLEAPPTGELTTQILNVLKT